MKMQPITYFHEPCGCPCEGAREASVVVRVARAIEQRNGCHWVAEAVIEVEGNTRDTVTVRCLAGPRCLRTHRHTYAFYRDLGGLYSVLNVSGPCGEG